MTTKVRVDKIFIKSDKIFTQKYVLCDSGQLQFLDTPAPTPSTDKQFLTVSD